MKNKRLAYLLVPLVLLVWGLIAQRIWLATSADAPDTPKSLMTPMAKRLADQQRQPRLLLAYGDPFQGLSISMPVVPSTNREAVVSKAYYAAPSRSLNLPIITPVVVAPVVWPQVKYLGLIANSGKRNQVVLLAIDDQEVIVKAGRSSHGLQLVNVFRDSVQLSFGKQRKSFFRSAQ